MNKLYIYIGIAIIFFSCGEKQNKDNSLFTTANNFDAHFFWINTNTITRVKSNSGFYSAKIDTAVEFGIGISARIEELTGSVVPGKVEVRCRIFSPVSKPDASIVVDPVANNQTLGWQSHNINEDIIKPNEWTEVTANFKLPENITPDTELKIYFWNPNKMLFYVDDIEISLE